MASRVTDDRIAAGVNEYFCEIKKSPVPSPLRKTDFYKAMRTAALGSQYTTLRSQWARFTASKYVKEIIDDNTVVPNIYLITR